jgi:hypothetical protein
MEAALVRHPGAQPGVARVLAVAPVAPHDVKGDAQGPERNQAEHQQLAVAGAVPQDVAKRGNRQQDDGEQHVDDADIAQRDADQPEQDDRADGDAKAGCRQRQEMLQEKVHAGTASLQPAGGCGENELKV